MARDGHTPRAARGDDDAPLLERLRRGEREAFDALVERHAGALLRVARALLRDASAAEEVVQETWLALLDGIDRFEGRAALRTWLLRILVNKARTRRGRDGRTVPFSALAAGDEGGDEGGPAGGEFTPDGHWAQPPARWADRDPERLAIGAETRRLLEDAVAALPAAQRAVLVLRDVEGLDADEICNLLGITLTNQRVLLHRARARLRAALGRTLGEGP